MAIALWVVQALLALAFIFAGFMKATRPIEQLVPMMPWTGVVPARLVRFIGVAELLGGIGLVLPALTGIQPWLTPAAAIGLALIQLLAIGFHARRREFQVLPINLLLGALAIFVAYGRIALVPA